MGSLILGIFVIAGGGDGNSGSALGTVDTFMQMLMVKTAKDLQLDSTISVTPKQ